MRYTAIAVIYNPNSTGSSKTLAQQFEAQVLERLPKQKILLIETKYAGHGEVLSYEIATSSKKPLIISSSGDGGYSDVINGAMRANKEGFNATTGLLPAGNANDHYANVHTVELIEQIVSGTTMKIDLLKLSSVSGGQPLARYAHSYIGFGLTPHVAAELNKNKLNPINEAFIVARSLFAIKPVRLKIGKVPRYYESLIFSNVDVMSKYLKISSPSSMTDGKFEITVFTRRNKLRLILLLLKASFKGVEEDLQASEFLLTTVQETLVQMDGEILALDADTDVLITIEKQILRCIV